MLRKPSHNLRSFLAGIGDDPDFGVPYVRGRAVAQSLGVRELRTKKHTHQAVVWDVLGNATILDRKGRVRQLIGDETKEVI